MSLLEAALRGDDPPGRALGIDVVRARRGPRLAAAAEAILAETFTDDRATAIVVHTLAEWSTSTCVLEKAGFGFDSERRRTAGASASGRVGLPPRTSAPGSRTYITSYSTMWAKGRGG